MKKKTTRALALALAGALAASTLTACGAGKEDSSGSSSTKVDITPAADNTFVQNEDGSFVSGGIKFPLEEKVTYTFFRTADATTLDVNGGDVANNEFWQELERRTNVHFEFITPAVGTEREQYNLTITSGELPDVMSNTAYYQDGLDNGIDDGYFLDLTDLLPIYAPDYLAVLEATGQAKDVMTDDGRYASIGMIFNHPQAPFVGPMVRGDWLEELGLSVPETYEEWEEMLIAFKEKKGCEAPLTMTKSGYWNLGAGYGVYGGALGTTFYQVDGKVYDSLLDNPEGCKEYFTMLNRWYEKGLLDQNFMTATGYNPDPSFLNTGVSGAAQAMYSSVDTSLLPVQEAGGKLVAMPWPVKEKGDVLHYSPAATNSIVTPSVTISASCENPEILLAMFNYLFTEEGYMLENYGIEGEHYTLNEDGSYTYTDLMLENVQEGLRKYTMPPSWGPSWVDVDRQNVALSQSSIDMMEVWTVDASYKIPDGVALSAEEKAEYADISADLLTYVEENCLQFITGAKSFDEWDSFIDTVEQLGMRRCCEIYQQALDRYNAR